MNSPIRLLKRAVVLPLALITLTAAAQDASKPASPAPSPAGQSYKFVNHTGKFTDDECFWSLDGGKTWNSFAKEPTVPCPHKNGRVYFQVGKEPKKMDDHDSRWDFIEYASNGKVWNGNTTQVDAFGLPLTVEMGDKKVGVTESRDALFADFLKNAPGDFKSCVKDQWRIVSPAAAAFGEKGTSAHYFDAYIDGVWAMYATEKKTPSGKYTGKVTDGALTFTPVGGGKAYTCKSKPTTQEALRGTGVLASNPRFCAAINRHVLADPADWDNAAAYYKAEPCNWYAKFMHEHNFGNKAYGFCYDDDGGQAAFFSAKGDEVLVTLYWNAAPAK